MLISWIVDNDARLFCDSKRDENPLTVDDAFRQAADAIASFGPISRTHFDAVVDGNCRFFRQPLKLQRASENEAFTNAEWDELQRHCRTLRADMQKLNLRQCVILLRTKMKTNARQLLGLPKPFHVWKGAAASPDAGTS
jgi:hypothetical protein